MITVPSAEHERALWVEKHLQSDQQKQKTSTTSVRENKSCSSLKFDSGSGVGGENEHLLVRSISDDSVLEKQTNDTWEWDKERAKSAVQVQNQSTRKPMVKVCCPSSRSSWSLSKCYGCALKILASELDFALKT